EFAQLWQRLQPWRPYLKVISISCPDHDQVVPYLEHLYALMAPLEVPLIWQTDGRPMSGDLGKGTTHAAIRLAQKILEAGLPGYVQPAGGTNGYTVGKLLDLGLINNAPSIASPQIFPSSAGSLPSAFGKANSAPAAMSSTIAGIAYGSYGRAQLLPLLDSIDQELQPWLGHASLDQPSNGQLVSTVAGVTLATAAPWQRLDESRLGQGLALARQLVGQLKSDGHFLSTRYG
ncbi:MAG TPA: LdpA C-terminal domain-containing domain, partial [Nodosilinea sp.]|nr:LdpA C-terminal domain-containing domain [Nodosilinea sp.]